jgi:hypothetical protein
MLGRDEGATRPAIGKAMGWAPHTVRGSLAGLAKKIEVEVLERARQVRANKVGAKGSYTIYHVTKSCCQAGRERPATILVDVDRLRQPGSRPKEQRSFQQADRVAEL